MRLINTATNEYPVSYERMMENFKNTSFPPGEVMAPPFPFAPVYDEVRPEFNPLLQTVEEVLPVLNGGVWRQAFIVKELFATQAEKDAAIAADMEKKRKASIPESLPMWQARDILIERGHLSTIKAIMAGIADPVKREKAQSKFEFSNTLRRDDPLLAIIAPLIPLTEIEIDQLFIDGSNAR